MRRRTLWHFTPRKRVMSILKTGLDPQYSQGHMTGVWYCTYRDMLNVLYHLVQTTGIPWHQWAVLRCNVALAGLRRTPHSDRYVSTHPLEAQHIREEPGLTFARARHSAYKGSGPRGHRSRTDTNRQTS